MATLRAQANDDINNAVPNWAKDFPVVGQGVIIFNIVRDTSFSIFVLPKCDTDACKKEWIALVIENSCANFIMCHNGELTTLETVRGTVKGEAVGLEPQQKISYWFSYNRDMLALKYGKGYVMDETTLMEHSFLEGKRPEEYKDVMKEYEILFSPYIRRRIEQYDVSPYDELSLKYAEIIKRDGFEGVPILKKYPSLKGQDAAEVESKCKALAKSIIDIERKVAFQKNPLNCNWSPFVLDSSKVDLFQLDSKTYTFSASLPSACSELFSNATAPNVELDWPYTDEYKLSDAIQHSLTDPNGILRTKIDEKEDEFGNEKMKYLRVTLGQDRGSSPGIPYVLEIWPADHGSPIHNHGNSYAVIKVVYGGLTIQVFNKHTNTQDTRPLQEFNVSKGDCTWISPNWFQTHKLWNHNKVYCATIQCYQYGTHDFVHWPYFDYVADTEVIDEFLPNSDFTFREMREKVMKEYSEFMEKNKKV